MNHREMGLTYIFDNQVTLKIFCLGLLFFLYINQPLNSNSSVTFEVYNIVYTKERYGETLYPDALIYNRR